MSSITACPGNECIFWCCGEDHYVLKTVPGVLKSKFFCTETRSVVYHLSPQ